MRRLANLLRAAALVFATTAAAADTGAWDLRANVGLESRLFAADARWAGQPSARAQAALAATAELRWRSADGDRRAAFVPFLRWDATDDERSLADLSEAYWAHSGESFEVLLGMNTVFWGVTESVQLVDIVNQTDASGDIDGEDKLGQPMISAVWQSDVGEFSAFVLPGFRERRFPGVEGRLRPALPVDTGRTVYASDDGAGHADLALRYSHFVGDLDVGLSVFSGTSREPRLVPSPDGAALIPHYDLIDQFGVDLQFTREAWLWKLEAILRDGYSHRFAAVTGGFEYTFFQVGASAADIGVLVEYQYDGRNGLEPPTAADNDVFVGGRLAMNDTSDTAVLGGLAYDLDTGEAFVSIEAERRIGEDVVVELRVRGFAGASPGDVSYSLGRDDYLQLQVAKFF